MRRFSFKEVIPGNSSRILATNVIKIPTLKRSSRLHEFVRLDYIANLQVIVVLDPDAALEGLLDLPCVLLEPLQRTQRALVDRFAVAHDANLILAVYPPFSHITTGDSADLRNLEDLSNFGSSDEGL